MRIITRSQSTRMSIKPNVKYKAKRTRLSDGTHAYKLIVEGRHIVSTATNSFLLCGGSWKEVIR